MILRNLRVQNVRIHDQYATTLSSAVTLISGANGSGKTSLIEAIYIALRGRSFRGSDEAIMRQDTAWYRIDLETNNGVRTVISDWRGAQNKKTFSIDDKRTARLPQNQKYPIVLFEPDDLRVINGSPSRRREMIDTMISQTNPRYQTTLRRYERALLQRNRLLKSSCDPSELFPWNAILSESGAVIIAARRAVIREINQSITEVYRQISNTQDEIGINYTSGEMTSSELFAAIERNLERDQIVGSTSVGPHRHDIEFWINKRAASSVGSRGEVRTIVLAMKFIEASYIEKQTGEKPIILLDDVFGELDEHRQQLLLREFVHHQIIMTSASVANGQSADQLIELS